MLNILIRYIINIEGGQQRRGNRAAKREISGVNERDGVAVVRRRGGRRPRADAGGLAVRAAAPEHTAPRLAETIRCGVVEEDHILQHRER